MPPGGRRTGAGRKPGAQPETIAKHEALERQRILKADEWATEIGLLSKSDIGLLCDEAGYFIPLHKLPPEVRRCLASVKVTKKNLTAGDGKQEDVVEYKFWDKLRALEMFGRNQGLLVEKVEVTGKVTLAEKIAKARARLAKVKP